MQKVGKTMGNKAMSFFQKLGKAIMLPVAALPLCGILMGIGYILCPASMQGSEIVGAVPTAGLFLVKAGGAIIDHMALLFAIGIGIGMAHEKDSTAAIASLVSWLMLTTLLRPELVTQIIPSVSGQETALLAYKNIENPFIGIICGLIGSQSYNRFKDTKLPEWLAFFSGKRCTVIMSGLFSIIAAAILLFIWPLLFGLLVLLGKKIVSMGAAGAGIYAFLNRLLLPFGLHHALNNVFWFDTIGLGDLTHFWAGETSADVSWSLGMYMSGFFPCMMFGIPGASAAMIRSADKSKRRYAMSILVSAAVCSFVCGITEPFEFAFMFVSPPLYVLYALLYGIFATVTALLGFRAGFAFSGGVTDLVFSASLPAAERTWLIIPLGLAAFAVFYLLFRVMIKVFDIRTPGRYDESDQYESAADRPLNGNVAGINIPLLLEGLGGTDNIRTLDNCITRLRLEMNDTDRISESKLKGAGAKGVMRISGNGLQVVIGLNVQSVADELAAIMKSSSEKKDRYIIRCSAGKIMQPVKGKVISQQEIPDETFSAGVLGEGVGIIPEDNKIIAPCDGVITTVTDTAHAVGIESDGMEILIHVGIDTVKMNGDGFKCYVSEGDTITRGQLLITFDRDKIRAADLSDIVAIMLSNSDELSDVECMTDQADTSPTDISSSYTDLL